MLCGRIIPKDPNKIAAAKIWFIINLPICLFWFWFNVFVMCMYCPIRGLAYAKICVGLSMFMCESLAYARGQFRRFLPEKNHTFPDADLKCLLRYFNSLFGSRFMQQLMSLHNQFAHFHSSRLWYLNCCLMFSCHHKQVKKEIRCLSK